MPVNIIIIMFISIAEELQWIFIGRVAKSQNTSTDINNYPSIHSLPQECWLYYYISLEYLLNLF